MDDIQVKITATEDVGPAASSAAAELTALGGAAEVAGVKFQTMAQSIDSSLGLTQDKIKSASASAAVFGESLAGQSALSASALGSVATSAAAAEGAIAGTTQAAATSRPMYEALVMVHEALQGRFTRMPASAMIGIQALGGVSMGAVAAGAALIGLVAAVGYVEYETYKAQQNIDRLTQSFIDTGRAAELSGGFMEQWVSNTFSIFDSTQTAHRALAALEAQDASLNATLIESVHEILPHFVEQMGEKGAVKAAAGLEKALADLSVNGLRKLDTEMLGLTPVQYETIKGMIDMGDKAGAAQQVLEILGQRGGVALDSLRQAQTKVQAAVKEAQGALEAEEAAGTDDAGVMGILARRVDELRAQEEGLARAIRDAGAAQKEQDFKADVREAEDINQRYDQRGNILKEITKLTGALGEAQHAGNRQAVADLGSAIMEEQEELKKFDDRVKNDAYNTWTDMENAKAEAAKSGSAARIKIAQEEVIRAGEMYGTESIQYFRAQGRLNEEKRAASAEGVRIARQGQREEDQILMEGVQTDIEIAKMRIAARRDELEAEVTDAKITRAQELDQLRFLLDEEYRLDEQSIDRTRSQYGVQTKDYAKYTDDLRKLGEKWVEDSAKLDRMRAAASHQADVQEAQSWRQAVVEMTAGEGTFIRDILSGRMTLTGALANMAGEMVQKELAADARYLVSKLLLNEKELAAEKALNQAGLLYRLLFNTEKTAADTTSATADAGVKAAAAATDIATQKATAAMIIPVDAALTFGGVFANLAPVMGPLAAGPAAASEAAVMAQLGVASAAGGELNVPGGLYLLHPKETVMPASVANPMRDFFSGGASAGDTIHIHIQAWDGASVRSLFMNEGDALVAGLMRAKRNLHPDLMGMGNLK